MRLFSLLSIVLVLSVVEPIRCQELVLPSHVLSKQAALPEAVTYGILFHQIARFKDLADERDRLGLDGSIYRKHLTAKFGLSADELITVNLIALQYREDVKEAETKLRLSIDKFRDANALLSPGSRILPLPPEARTLLAARDAVTLSARDQLYHSLGADSFARVDAKVKSSIQHDTQHNGGTSKNAK